MSAPSIVAHVVAVTRSAQSYASREATQDYRDAFKVVLLGHAKRVLRDRDAVHVFTQIGSTHAAVRVISHERHMVVTICVATGEARVEEIGL